MDDVSLYVPCFNAAATIGLCLDGVLGQSFPLKEVIVVDDGSSDDTLRVVSRYPVRVVRHEANRGLAAARNSAIRQTKSDFIASVDADCVCEKGWLEKLMGCFASPGIVGAGGKLLETRNTRPADLWRAAHMKQHWGDTGAKPPFLFGANTVFLRGVLEDAGLYDETFKNNYEDVDLCGRLKKSGHTFVYEPKAVVYHLREDDSLTVLNTYWCWHLVRYRQENFYAVPERFRFKIKESLGTANRYLEEDMKSGRRTLVYLDLLFAFHHSLNDLKLFLAQRQKDSDKEVSKLSLWLALADLVFFCRFDADVFHIRTFLKTSSALSQNYFALVFILGRYLMERFPSENFRKILFRNILWTLYGIDDFVLSDKFWTVVQQRPDWRCLLEKSHPHLDKDFLEEFFQTFVVYMERLRFRFPDVIAAIETSAPCEM
jgi:glycosyltransferase involved in cell wall biosynthesis